MLVTSPVRIKYVAFLLFVTSHFRCSSFFVQICCLQNINVLKIKSLLLFLKNISKQAESDVCFNWVRFRSPVQIFCRIRSHVLLISFNFKPNHQFNPIFVESHNYCSFLHVRVVFKIKTFFFFYGVNYVYRSHNFY